MAPQPKTVKGLDQSLQIRSDSMGYNPNSHHHDDVKIESLGFQGDESQIFRAYKASNHYKSRGKFWNDGKRDTLLRYINLTFIGIFQGTIAYFTNYIAKSFIDVSLLLINTNVWFLDSLTSIFGFILLKSLILFLIFFFSKKAKFDRVTEVVVEGSLIKAFFILYYRQLLFAAWASGAVMIEPMSGGSGIPEVKCFLNGIDLPRINDFKTGVCKILGVIGSVSAGLPVGKEGPMVHSGAVVAATISNGRVRDDKTRRDYVAAGAAAGVCTAFSAPIGGFLFAFEEGASYWSQSLTFRTFYTSGWAIATLYILNTVGIRFHKIGFDKLFSFGNFAFEGSRSSYEIWELLVFILLGILGGLIGAIFNDTNERLTHWRIKHVNHTKWRRFAEVLIISSLVSVMMFAIPYIWQGCMPLPSVAEMSSQEEELVGHLNQFTCDEGFYNPVASLFLADGNDAIKLLFHMHERTFPFYSLILFFTVYISLATITYGIAVPSGLFVPSLLAGAAFGRLFGNLIYKITPYNVAFSNVYSLIGAAAVLGGMARMTISLTVS